MPLNEIPKHLTPEVRSLIEAALEDAWQELNKDGTPEAAPARNKLRRTMVALAPLLEKPIIKAHVVRHPCLVRSAAIVVSTTRAYERNGGLKLLWEH